MSRSAPTFAACSSASGAAQLSPSQPPVSAASSVAASRHLVPRPSARRHQRAAVDEAVALWPAQPGRLVVRGTELQPGP
jgi:hypothetical protein